MRVAGLDVGGSSVKAWVRDLDTGAQVTTTVATATVRPAAHRAEFVPDAWQLACRRALADAVERAGPGDCAGLTVCSLRQGFVLLDGGGEVLGNGILNSDRRGAPYAQVLAGTHPVTGHWPAPELTLPKLLAVRAQQPDRWAATARVLFVHDWLLWLLTGVQVTETSYACAGAMADVTARSWADALLADCGIAIDRLATLVAAGTPVGPLAGGWSLRAGTPVIAGCGDTQLAAMGLGGLADGVVTVIAGSSTPVQVATARPVCDPLARPWVSTHAAADLWAAEGNAGYPGTASGWWSAMTSAPPATDSGGVIAVTAAPYWSERTWSRKPPTTLLGMTPATTAGQVSRALLEAHAFAVRGNVQDLERALGRTASHLVMAGGAAADGALPDLAAEVLGREVRWTPDAGPAAGGAVLVARALGENVASPGLPERVVPAGDPGPHEAVYDRWLGATEALRAAVGE